MKPHYCGLGPGEQREVAFPVFNAASSPGPGSFQTGQDDGKTRSGPKRPAAEIRGGGFFGIYCLLGPILVHCYIRIFSGKFWFVVRRLRTSRFFSGKLFEAVLASIWPQRPNLNPPLALSWPTTPSYHLLGCSLWPYLPF